MASGWKPNSRSSHSRSASRGRSRLSHRTPPDAMTSGSIPSRSESRTPGNAPGRVRSLDRDSRFGTWRDPGSHGGIVTQRPEEVLGDTCRSRMNLEAPPPPQRCWTRFHGPHAGAPMQQDLARRAREGDHEAFSALVREVLGRLYTTARLIVHDADRADDAVQDALIQAWRDIGGLRDL